MVDDIPKAATDGGTVYDRPCFTASAMPGHNGKPIAVMSWHRGEPIAVRLEKVDEWEMARCRGRHIGYRRPAPGTSRREEIRGSASRATPLIAAPGGTPTGRPRLGADPALFAAARQAGKRCKAALLV